MSRLPAEPKLVGRDHEIEQLTQYLHSALNGNGAAVFISGEAGVGKTRLVSEFLTLAKKKGAGIFAGWCLSEANIPYFPFREAFNSYISAMSYGKTKSVISQQLRTTGWLEDSEFAQEPRIHEPYLTPQIERDRTFEAAARVLLQLSTQEPLILFLDDLHWADPLSLALLHYLSRECRDSRLLIIGTYRLEELAHTEGERPHPLEETMFSMSREDLLTKMELTRLKRNDFPELLKSIFRSSLNEEFEEKLFEETEGNPLFAIEMLNMLADEGLLSEKDERWALTAPMEKIGIPSKVYEVIARRILRLDRKKRKLLDIAAVCGHYFTPDTLSRVLTLDLADVLQMLVELEQKHRLLHSVDSEFEFTHHKIREVIYGSLSTELRRIYHLKIAHCFEQALAKQITDGYMADMALHSIEGGASEKAFEYLLKLGEKAASIHANAQAIDYLNKALEIAQKTSSLATNENLAKIYKHRGIAWLSQDERTKARSDFNFMLQNATNISDGLMIAEAHYWLGSTYEPWFGEAEEAMHHLTTAIEMARKMNNKPLEARSLGGIGSVLMWGEIPDTVDEGRMRLEESSRICKEIGDKARESHNLEMLGLYYNWKGEFNRAKESLNKALALGEEIRSTPVVTFSLFVLSMVLAGNGEYNNAISTGQRCLKLSRDSGHVSQVCMVLNTLGWIYHDLSNIELAIKCNNEAIESAKAHQKSRASGAVPSSLLNLAMDHLYNNDYENAEKYFKEVINAYQQHRVGWWRIETRMLLGRGEIALAEGDYQQARKFAEDSLALSEKADAKKYVAKGLKLKAEVLSKMGNMEEAVNLMENALKLALQVGNPPLLWQIQYSMGCLLEKNGNPQEASKHYARAITLIEAVASKLDSAILRSTLLTSQDTRAIRDAYTRTKLIQEKAVGLERFGHADIQAHLTASEEVTVEEEVEVRLDLANVAKESVLLVRIDELIPSGFKAVAPPSRYSIDDGSIDMKGKKLDPLKVETIKLNLRATKSGILNLNPKVVYVDDLGKFRTCITDPITVTVHPRLSLEFKTRGAQNVFNYLVISFVEDYMRRRLTVQEAGWRSFVQIIRNAKVSSRSVYGSKGHHGPAISELERRGLIETRIFLGERGRGGKIVKTRIS
ncbi:MAG: tetratricopeptide repeat protein, partial [Candidatus Bathyarchaeia archaeon]